jgi:hypothetical protein
MKRFLLLFSFVAALLTASCSKPEPQKFENGITATFNVTLPGEIATKAISDGNQATELLFRVFDSENRLLSDLNQTVQVSGKRATVTAKLVRGVKYQFVFWAQKPGQFAISDANLTIPANKLSTMMNNDAFDAFYAFKAVDPKQEDFSADVTLYRPFAQINVGASAADIAVAQDNKVDVAGNLKTFYTIKGVKNTLNLLTGAVSGSENVTYTAATAPTDNITATDGSAYRRIAMVYVLAAPQSATVPVTVNVQSKQNGSVNVNFSREVPNVPVRRNHRTNIVGEIFSLQGTFNVLVDSNFDRPDTEVQIDVPAPTPTKYTVTIQSNIPNGSVALTSESNEFEEGETVTLTATPNENYELSYLAYTPDQGGVATEINLKTLQFPMPASNVNVTARFSYVEPGPTPGGEGSGTADDPYTVAGVRAFIDGLGAAGTVSENPVYVKGVVSRIASAPSTQYTNASFYMTDPNGTDEFEAFRINFFNDAPWTIDDPMVAVGDEVVVFGKVTLYSSNNTNTYETYQKKDVYNGYLISINGMQNVMAKPTITAKDASGATTTVIPANGFLTVNIYAAKSADIRYTTDGSTPTKNSTQFTSDFTVSDACTVKAIAFADGSLPSAVASLTLTKESGPTPGGEGSGTADDPYTVAGVRAYIDGLGGQDSADEVYVKGVVSNIVNQFSADFGNATFDITDPNGSDFFECYRVLFFNGEKWVKGNPTLAIGDEVVICSKVTYYASKQLYETVFVSNPAYNGHLVSLNGKSAFMTAPTISATNASGAPATEIPAAAGSYLKITISGENVHYTIDGSDPTENSPTYSAPFNVTEACTIKAISAGNASTLSSAVVSIVITKASSGGDTPGDALTITLDKAAFEAVSNFPKATGTTKGTYTIAGYSFSFNASTAFYWNSSSNFLMLGKANSYILTPAISGKKLTKIEFKTGGNASENVIVDVFDANGTNSLGVNSEKLKKGTVYTWPINGSTNTSYQIRVTNAYNAQFQYLKLTFE